MKKVWFVYIVTNKKNWTLYVGVTSNLEKRIFEHKNKKYDWFTAKYWLDILVRYCELPSIKEAIILEKNLKAWSRKRKINMIETINENWNDLSYCEWIWSNLAPSHCEWIWSNPLGI